MPRTDETTRSPEFNPQATEGPGGNGWGYEAVGEMGEEERRAYELALADKGEEDSMEDGEDDLTLPFAWPVPKEREGMAFYVF